MEYQALVAGIIRHILTATGGGALATAFLTGGTLESVVGAVFTLGGFVWSAFAKRK